MRTTQSAGAIPIDFSRIPVDLAVGSGHKWLCAPLGAAWCHLGERLLKRSPLLDVAGMLRSFDYAGAAALRLENPADAARLEPWARAWVESISAQDLE